MSKLHSKIMVAITAGDWEGIQHRPHHFANRAAKSGRTVIYVEPPVSLIGPLKNRSLLANWKRWINGYKQVDSNLYVVAPPPTIPFGGKFRVINKINQYIFSRSLKKILGNFNGELELYSYLPNSVDLLKHISFTKVYYDCVDDHASFTGLINPSVVNQMEKELMEKADVSFATANQLLEDRRDWSKNFHLVPNGAEYEKFAVVQQEKLPIPADIERIKKPIIGFYGGISDWINLEVIAQTAKKLPNCSFVLIGPVDTAVDQYKNLPNLHFMGSRKYQQLPGYIQSFDICLIPFKINKLTKSVNPIKMYEYLSSGKPVVSTPLPEVLNYSNIIEIVTNEEEMSKAITAILDNPKQYNSQEAVGKRQNVGKENSWDARWSKVLTFIDNVK